MENCRVVSLSDDEIDFLKRAIHALQTEIHDWMPGEKKLLWRAENRYKSQGEEALERLDRLMKKIEFLAQHSDGTEIGLSTKLSFDDE